VGNPAQIILLMGVAGSGKTTVGRGLAGALGWPYFEADDFHSAANKAKMAAGMPLDDDDRAPWLAAIRAEIDACRAAGRSAVFTCSALKEKYRRVLMDGAPEVSLVHLSGDPATIAERVASRPGHYMKAGMVGSQFAALEPPVGALTFDTRALRPPAIIAAIRGRLRL
jgi:gluconokinase